MSFNFILNIFKFFKLLFSKISLNPFKFISRFDSNSKIKVSKLLKSELFKLLQKTLISLI